MTPSATAVDAATRNTVRRLGSQVLCVAVVPLVLSTVTMRTAGLAATAVVTLVTPSRFSVASSVTLSTLSRPPLAATSNTLTPSSANPATNR